MSEIGEGEEVEILNDIFYKAKKLPQLKNGQKRERERKSLDIKTMIAIPTGTADRR